MKLYRTFSIVTLSTLGIACDQAPPATAPGTAEGAEEVLRDSLGKQVGDLSRAIILRNPQAEPFLVARVEVQPNELLEYYEPRPGALVISGAGAPGAPPMLNAAEIRSADPRLLWQRMAKGRPMPAALETAIARQGRLRLEQSDSGLAPGWGGGNAQEPVAAERKPGPKAEAASSLQLPDSAARALEVHAQSGWCDSGYYSQGYGAACPSVQWATWYHCKDNWWNGIWAQHNDAATNATNVCPATGPVTLVMNNSDWNINPWYYDVPQNTVRWWNYSRANTCMALWDDCPTIRADVTGASGDRFHFRFQVEKEW
jgi:hypothetical protein